MDNFKEEIVVRLGGRTMRILNKIAIYILLIVFGIIGIMGVSFVMQFDFSNGFSTIVGLAELIIGGGLAWFFWRKKDTVDTEIEYTFTNGEMDFAKVFGGRRRKNLFSMRIKEVEAGGLVESDSYKRYASMPEIKTIDLTLNENTVKHYLFFIKEGNKHLLLLECSNEMWDMLCQFNSRLDRK
ncbi:MAG: LPXTG cell wall anchor domain-containing protein [Clostridiales bacterium]|nr:LPXTG cell wall anchor domain-containing protein [Clostridiales bacterium]